MVYFDSLSKGTYADHNSENSEFKLYIWPVNKKQVKRIKINFINALRLIISLIITSPPAPKKEKPVGMRWHTYRLRLAIC